MFWFKLFVLVATSGTIAAAGKTILPAASIEPLQKVAKFYVWDHMINQVRWMCSWDTTQADVDNFVAAVKSELAN